MPNVQKLDYATIFIGLGGTGKDMLIAIKKKFREHLICEGPNDYPRRTAFLEMDADSNDCGPGYRITDGEFINLNVPDYKEIINPQNRNQLPDYENQWLCNYFPPRVREVGAGGIRQLGRLQLSRHADEFKAKFETVVHNNIVTEASNVGPLMKIDVVICAGLTGGTGSGTFLDVAFLVKGWLTDMFPGFATRVYGFFTLPNVYINDPQFRNIKTMPGKMELMKANAYAALKELDYWTNETPVQMDFVQQYHGGVKARWTGMPFDIAFLLDDKRIDGTPIADPYKHILNVVAEMMLYCYADEQYQGQGVTHSFDSFMSNVALSLATINDGRQLPVNYSFAALGVSTTQEVEQMVKAYETGKVIEKALEAPLVDPNTNTPVAPGQTMIMNGMTSVTPVVYYDNSQNLQQIYKNIFGSLLDFAPIDTDETAFRKMMDKELNAFGTTHQYTPLKPTKEDIKGATKALFEKTITSVLGNENNAKSWSFAAKESTRALLEAEWEAFQRETKSCIENIAIGPRGWYNFLAEKLIPRLTNLKDLWEGKENTSRQAYDNEIKAAENQSKAIRKFNAVESTAYTLNAFGKADKELDKYRSHEKNAVEGSRNCVYASNRKKAMEMLKDRVEKYAKVLNYMLDQMERVRTESEDRLNSIDAANFLVNKQQLEKYFLNQVNSAVSIEEVRDSVRREIAEHSFQADFVHGPGTTEEQQKQDRQELIKLVDEFLDIITKKANMVNMDWIINALQPNPAEQDLYMQEHICRDLDVAAKTMLPEINALNENYPPVEHRYLAVPSNAPLWVAGFNTYAHEMGHTEVKRSLTSDRVLWLKVRMGISAANILDTQDLQAEYERIVGNDLGKGIHLYNSLSFTRYTENWKSKESWCLLPSLLPYELLYLDGRYLTGRQKDNWQEVRNAFTQAVNANLVNFLENGCFTIRFMKNNMHHDDFRMKVDEIVQSGKMGYRDRLNALDAQTNEWMTTSDEIKYAQYFSRAQTLEGIRQPGENASQQEKEAFRARQSEAKLRLCAFIAMQYPNYIENLQNQLVNMAYLAECRKKLIDHINEEEGLKAEVKKYARMVVCGRFAQENGYITFKYQNEDADLMEMDFRTIDPNILDLPVTDRKKIREDYWEALMLIQLYRDPGCIDSQKKAAFEFERKQWGYYDDSLRGFIRNHQAAYNTYVERLEAISEKYTQFTGFREACVSSIDSDPILSKDDDFSLRQMLKIPYMAMLEQIEDDKERM